MAQNHKLILVLVLMIDYFGKGEAETLVRKRMISGKVGAAGDIDLSDAEATSLSDAEQPSFVRKQLISGKVGANADIDFPASEHTNLFDAKQKSLARKQMISGKVDAGGDIDLSDAEQASLARKMTKVGGDIHTFNVEVEGPSLSAGRAHMEIDESDNLKMSPVDTRKVGGEGNIHTHDGHRGSTPMEFAEAEVSRLVHKAPTAPRWFSGERLKLGASLFADKTKKTISTNGVDSFMSVAGGPKYPLHTIFGVLMASTLGTLILYFYFSTPREQRWF